MGTYNLPRNVKGEGRILFIFTGKSFLYTIATGAIGVLIAFIVSLISKMLKVKSDPIFAEIIIVAVFALIGFVISTFKVPDIARFEFSKKTGGENIDDVIRRAIKFKAKGKKIYIYKANKAKEEKENAR